MKEERIHEKVRILGKNVEIRAVLVLFSFLSSLLICPFLSAQTDDSISTAQARAGEARKKAGDFEGNLYFPGEWEAAETAADYDRIFELAVPLYAQAREDEIMAMRDYLITLGAKKTFSEYLMDADRTALLAYTQYGAEDYYSAKDSAAIALEKFTILETAFNAWLLRVEIRERGFTSYDSANFDLGGEMLVGAMDAYMAGDLAGAKGKAEEALSTFNIALSTAWSSYAELRSLLAEGERLAALDMKTDIAAKDFFSKADSDNKTALELLESKQYEAAAKLFINAEAMYVIASITTLEKRRTAAVAIRNANEKIQESDTIAREADNNIKGGQK